MDETFSFQLHRKTRTLEVEVRRCTLPEGVFCFISSVKDSLGLGTLTDAERQEIIQRGRANDPNKNVYSKETG